MSLNVDLTRIANRDTVCFVGEGDARKWSDLTNTIGFLTIAADIGDITEANAEEFYIRACLLCDLYGGNSRDGGVPSLADIRAHIGMRTNVITLTRAKWLAKVKSNNLPNRLREYKWRLDCDARLRAAGTIA
jgi:hypothetical protein